MHEAHRSFCNFRVQNKRSGVYLGWICEVLFIQNLRRKYSFHSLLFTQVDSLCTSHVGQGIQKICGGGGCERGYPPPTPGSFCIFRVQNKRSGAYFWWICEVMSIQNLRRKTQFQSLLYTIVDAWDTSHVGRGIRKICGGGGCVPLPHQGVFAFLGFKISDLVHTFGEFVK